MKIVELIKQSAELLNLTEVRTELENITVENESEVLSNHYILSLFNLSKFSIQELCTNYVPVSMEESVKITNGKYPVSFLENFIRIQNVTKQGEAVAYKVINRNIVVDVDGEYEIKYLTYPSINSIFDEIDFLEKFNPDVIVYGLCAYFSLAHGVFDEFNAFHEIYVEKAENLKELRTFNMPQRRWE